MAIIDGLLIKISEEYYVLPLSVVEECIELNRKESEKTDRQHIVNVRGEIVPYIRLRDQFEVKGELPAIEQIVITDVNSNKVGFVVDQVVGEHQTVIKNLSRIYRNVKGLSGATILGDGTVALILDLPKLIQSGEELN